MVEYVNKNSDMIGKNRHYVVHENNWDGITSLNISTGKHLEIEVSDRKTVTCTSVTSSLHYGNYIGGMWTTLSDCTQRRHLCCLRAL